MLEAHQRSLFSDLLGGGGGGGAEASTSGTSKGRPSKRRKVAKEPQKGQREVYDGRSDDEGEDESLPFAHFDSEDEAFSSDDEDERPGAVHEVVFSDPSASFSLPSRADKREFMVRRSGSTRWCGAARLTEPTQSSKVKNALKRKSVADEANLTLAERKRLGKKAKKDAKGKGSVSSDSDDAEEEQHLQSLDASLAKLLDPKRGLSEISEIVRSLPVKADRAPKGERAPLPANTPRLLRKGQNEANLRRAKARDDALGRVKKNEREAKTKKESRKAKTGSDGSQTRGLRGAIGSFRGGELRLSKSDVLRGAQAPGSSSKPTPPPLKGLPKGGGKRKGKPKK